MKNLPFLSLLSALALAALAPAAHADASATNGLYLQYGHSGNGESKTSAYTLGATKPMALNSSLLGMQATGYWDLYGSHFSADNPRGSDYKTWLIGLTPTFRLRFDQGQSPWFVEGGIGVSYTDVLYRSDVKKFSTRFNFGDHLGVGYSFGANRNQEITLRLQHYSNASIKKPNPGENYVQLRYAHAF